MAVKQEEELVNPDIPGSIPDVIKKEQDQSLLDPNKTEGRRLELLLLDIWSTMWHNVRDLIQRFATKADLDPQTGKVRLSQLPDAVLGAVQYQGAYNANTNTPALDPAAAANKGHYYVVNVAGVSPVNGLEYDLGDWIISNGLAWEKVDNTAALVALVSSVFGRTGAITAEDGDYDATQVVFTPADASKWGNGVNRVKAGLEELKSLVTSLSSGKQDKLTFDSTPTLNSPNPVTSDGIKEALNGLNVGFTPISLNQYDTHPAFNTQHSFNVWVLKNIGGGGTTQPTQLNTPSGFAASAGAGAITLTWNDTNI